jgi:hypothetical protein
MERPGQMSGTPKPLKYGAFVFAGPPVCVLMALAAAAAFAFGFAAGVIPLQYMKRLPDPQAALAQLSVKLNGG